jgi:hypothetical protein
MTTLEAQQAKTRINELEDLMCNTDYTTTQGLFDYEQYQIESNKMWQIVYGEI